MNRFQFQLCSLVVIILLFTPRIQAIRRNLASGTSAESPTHPGQQGRVLLPLQANPGSSRRSEEFQQGQTHYTTDDDSEDQLCIPYRNGSIMIRLYVLLRNDMNI
ncbi:hypothetical protein QQP08_002914 [Theobroma cacao]|nr:hypothetical protein QQP08_002914 [Theobroma cacao]